MNTLRNAPLGRAPLALLAAGLFALAGCGVVTSAAGDDQLIFAGQAVTLDGAGAVNRTGGQLRFLWTQTGGRTVDLINADQPTAGFVAPLVTADEDLTFQLTVISDFGNPDVFSRDEVTITVRPSPTPVLTLPENISVRAGEIAVVPATVQEMGGALVTYTWNQLSGPKVTLDSGGTETLRFVAPAVETTATAEFELRATTVDGAQSTATTTVVLQPNYDPPTVRVSADQTVFGGQTVTVTANTSSDPAGGVLDHVWTVLRGSITLDALDEPLVNFTAPNVTASAVLTLQVTSTSQVSGLSATQVVDIVVEPYPDPIVDAGPDKVVNEGAPVSLDATRSSDPAGGTLTYEWLSPEGVTLSSSATGRPAFIAPEVTGDTVFTFTLTVTQAHGKSATTTVRVTVADLD